MTTGAPQPDSLERQVTIQDIDGKVGVLARTLPEEGHIEIEEGVYSLALSDHSLYQDGLHSPTFTSSDPQFLAWAASMISDPPQTKPTNGTLAIGFGLPRNPSKNQYLFDRARVILTYPPTAGVAIVARQIVRETLEDDPNAREDCFEAIQKMQDIIDKINTAQLAQEPQS